MKKFLMTIVALTLGFGLATAQNFTVTCNGQEVTEGCTIEVKGVVDMVEVFQLVGYLTVTNTSSDDLIFNMSYEAMTEVPEGGFVTICGFGNCISAPTFPQDHTIAPGASAGENHEMDALDVAYMPPYGDETPVTVKMTMMDKTANQNLTFTVKFQPGQAAPAANENLAKAAVKVYPNPAHSVVNFRMDNVKAGSVVVLRDLNGRTVRTAPAAQEVSMNLAGLASGMYFYAVEENKIVKTVGKLLVR